MLDDETTGANAVAIDLYVNSKAANAGIPIDAVETYAFQGGIFDGLSPEYQEVYLASGLLMCLDVDTMDQETKDALTAVLGEEALEPATQEALDAEVALIGTWMDQWKARDTEGFAAAYPKDEVINSDDELNSKLFTDRDPGMIAYAQDYLEQTGSHTGLMVVGAGHMIGSSGIVQGLRDLGYTVEVVPAPELSIPLSRSPGHRPGLLRSAKFPISDFLTSSPIAFWEKRGYDRERTNSPCEVKPHGSVRHPCPL